MKKIFNKIVYIIILLVMVIFGYFSDNTYILYCKILENKDLISLFGALIAGLFGFIVAVIPLAISLFKQDNDFIKKLMQEDNFKSFIRPLLNRFISCLKVMFYFFVFLLLLLVIKDFIFEYYKDIDKLEEYFNQKKIAVSILSVIYIYLIINFLYHIKIIIRDLHSLVNMFVQSKINK